MAADNMMPPPELRDLLRSKSWSEASEGWTDWQTPVMRGYRMKCCDCGLEHEAEFRVYRVAERTAPDESYGPELPAEEYRVQLRMRRTGER